MPDFTTIDLPDMTGRTVIVIPGNSYAGPSGLMEQRGAPKLVGRSSAAKDTDAARRLWDASEELTGVKFPL
jgi:hypothetical protein